MKNDVSVIAGLEEFGIFACICCWFKIHVVIFSSVEPLAFVIWVVVDVQNMACRIRRLGAIIIRSGMRAHDFAPENEIRVRIEEEAQMKWTILRSKAYRLDRFISTRLFNPIRTSSVGPFASSQITGNLSPDRDLARADRTLRRHQWCWEDHRTIRWFKKEVKNDYIMEASAA